MIQHLVTQRRASVRCVAVAVLFALLGATALLGPLATDSKAQSVEVTWGVKIPVRDGVQLNATIYKPDPMPEPLPVVFTLTPYTSDTYHDRAWYFARNGYVFALVDVRGRGNSEGEFDPFLQEAEDGHDIVEWFARQPWCNGKVAMWGGSYAGYDQWATAKEFPPHLATIVPAAAAFPGIDFPFWRNIPYPYAIQWQTLTSGVTANFNLFGQSEHWIQVFSRLYREHRSFTGLPELAGNLTTKFDTWVAHPQQDAYWDAMSPSDEEFSRLELPILTITGHYDGDQPGAMEFYKRHMQFASLAARQRHYLIIGPWDHGGTRTPRREVGGLVFGEASLLDLNTLHKEWYDWTMKDGPKPEFLEKRVAYYVVGSDEWKYVDSLESIASERRRLYLASVDGQANDAFRSGVLSGEQPGADVRPDSYVYDPLDTRPGELEQEQIQDYLTDQRFALNLFGNGLVYHSAPFEEDTEVTGYLTLVVWLALDVPDTDFEVAVSEILQDGSSVALTQDRMRARYRDSLREPKLVTPGALERYEFNGFFFFSRRISEGSRLRLVFKSPNSIYVQKNYNSGGVVAEESSADARTAHVTLYHDADHLSYLELPIVR
ncbi:MAG: CocE/NonD family hydrolase [Gemmatimonadota bacterium]|nr:MAG: CocE/NonD family hydrolase [Gemmatimonadota bacterium]